MALNYAEMLGGLRMGIDVCTITDADKVPHTKIPGYVPTYTLEIMKDMMSDNWEFYCEGDIVELTEKAHVMFEWCRVLEDGYPVFEVC